MKTGIIAIDPGYGGMENVGGSDANHTVSALGDLEKNLTLEVSILLAGYLKLKNIRFIRPGKPVRIYPSIQKRMLPNG